MNTTEHDPADDAAWADIRLRYEKGEEAIRSIGAEVGLSQLGLSLKAKAMGWTLRTKTKIKKAASKNIIAKVIKAKTTRGSILRLKDLVENRLSILEQELSSVKDAASHLQKGADLRNVHTLARTLEKVLELENAERSRKRKTADDFKHLDDSERASLADKIERLATQAKAS